MLRSEHGEHRASGRAIGGQRVGAEPDGDPAPDRATATLRRQGDRAALLGHTLLGDPVERHVGARRSEAEPGADRLLGDRGER